ncbi:MAG: hypothetical protein NVSMB65_17240 [Chloroflexota bacterium]
MKGRELLRRGLAGALLLVTLSGGHHALGTGAGVQGAAADGSTPTATSTAGPGGDQSPSADDQTDEQQVSSGAPGASDEGAVQDGQDGQQEISTAELAREETNSVASGPGDLIPDTGSDTPAPEADR